MANLDEQILAELQMLRKLKMLQFSEFLGISQQTISKMMAKPKKKSGEPKSDV